jgi:hypothetical protein
MRALRSTRRAQDQALVPPKPLCGPVLGGDLDALDEIQDSGL